MIEQPGELLRLGLRRNGHRDGLGRECAPERDHHLDPAARGEEEAIDLSRVALIRKCPRAELEQPSHVASLLLGLGLNDEGLNELPPELHAHCGGLRIWQYPTQFGPYLAQLACLRVRSYLEIGIRHGGSFVATAEYLEPFHRLHFSVARALLLYPSSPDLHVLTD